MIHCYLSAYLNTLSNIRDLKRETMKYHILILLTLSWNVFSEQCHDTDVFTEINEESIEEFNGKKDDASDLLHNQYYQFLLEQAEPVIQLDGVAGLSYNDIDQKLTQKRNDAFIDIISQRDIADTLKNRLIILCEYDELKSLCEQHSNFDPETTTNSQNVISFLRPLSIAHKNGDENKIDEIMDAMSNAQYANINFDKHLVLATHYANEFIKSIPPSTVNQTLLLVDPENLGYFEAAHSEYPNNKTLEEVINTMTAYDLAYTASYSFSVPGYGPLFDVCENKKFNAKCEKIGKIMIRGSALITQHVGYALLKKAALQDSNHAEARKMIFAKAKLWKYSTCLGELPEPLMGGFLHPAFFQAMFSTYQQGGSELEAIKTAVYAVYHAISDSGKTIAYDPYACEDILMLSDSAYLKKYTKDDHYLSALKELH